MTKRCPGHLWVAENREYPCESVNFAKYVFSWKVKQMGKSVKLKIINLVTLNFDVEDAKNRQGIE